ncbi:hypothetical protein C9374_003569 [Naegleria lovaniensis]|uniref:Uncharacterized protein n=1 Tax=Naegleria lovaniensis TaxID=51637 RepID=A0AA88KY95_NAELO|nr:uncharacterized protein C9374_003569 [Naegleria lovaniensis]KAG2393805.1 hypothetical protein C9374_003569 [Naegleria lovaniensis]
MKRLNQLETTNCRKELKRIEEHGKGLHDIPKQNESLPTYICFGKYKLEFKKTNQGMKLEDECLDSFHKSKRPPGLGGSFRCGVEYSEMIPPKLHGDFQERFIINIVQIMDEYYLLLFDLWKECWIDQSKSKLMLNVVDEPVFGIFFFENNSPYFLLLHSSDNSGIRGEIFEIDFVSKTITPYKRVQVDIHHHGHCNAAYSDFIRVHSTLFNLGRATKCNVKHVEKITCTDLSIDYMKVYGHSMPTINGSLLWAYNEKEQCGCIVSYGGLAQFQCDGRMKCIASDNIVRVDFQKETDTQGISYQVACLPFENWINVLSFSPPAAQWNAVGLIGGQYLVSLGGTYKAMKVETRNLCLFDCDLQTWVGVLEPAQDRLTGIYSEDEHEELIRVLRLNGKLFYLKPSNKLIYFGGTRRFISAFYADLHLIQNLGFYEIKLPPSILRPSLVFTFPWSNFYDVEIMVQ